MPNYQSAFAATVALATAPTPPPAPKKSTLWPSKTAAAREALETAEAALAVERKTVAQLRVELAGLKGALHKSEAAAAPVPLDKMTVTRAQFDQLSPAKKAEFCRTGGRIID